MKYINIVLDLLKATFPTLLPRLAEVFDKFKQKDPLVASIVLSLLIAVQAFFVMDTVTIDNEVVSQIIELVLTAIAALIGSRTYQFLPKEKEEKPVSKEV